jgi:hypothetical protein
MRLLFLLGKNKIPFRASREASRDSSVSIETGYGLHSPDSIHGTGRDFSLLHSAQTSGKVVSPTHPPHFTPQKHYYFSISGIDFC